MNCTLVGKIGLLIAGDIAQDSALAVVGLRAGWVHLNGPFVGRQGFVVALEVVENMPHLRVGEGMSVVYPNCSCVGGESLHGTV